MKQITDSFMISTNGESLTNITNYIENLIIKKGLNTGILNISIQHTTASLMIQENADDNVKEDLIKFFRKIIPNDILFKHNSEGDDDMPAHIKSSLNQTSCTVSVLKKKLKLGVWQGIFLFEHRKAKKNREIFFHFIGN